MDQNNNTIEKPVINNRYPRINFSPFGGSLLIGFSIVILFVSLGDAIMSYTTPGYIQEHLDNSGTLMGFIMATSSVVGALSDFLFGKWFKARKFAFFLRWTFIFALSFPLTLLLLPAAAPTFIMAMAIWGIYYELIGFSNSQFIDNYTTKENNTFAWGIVIAFKSVSYTLGPVIAQLLSDQGETSPFIATIFCLVIGFMGFVVLFRSRKLSTHKHVLVEVKEHTSIKHELKVWKVLIRSLWHLLLFSFILSLIDATFWTTGTILSEDLTNRGAPAGLLLVFYSIPSLFVGGIAGRAAKPYGKKRAAFATALVSCIFLILVGFTDNITVLLGLVLVSSIFTSITWPELHGAFADYTQRLSTTKNDLIGVQGWATNVAYILGPISAGFISDQVGAQKTFSVIGMISLVVIIIVIVSVPRKVKMPQSALQNIPE